MAWKLLAGCLLLAQLTACSNSHGARRDPPDAPAAGSGESAGATNDERDAAVATDPPDAAPQRPATVDGAVPQGPVECAADRFPPLPAVCPAQLPDPRELGETCTLGGATCRYLLDDGLLLPHVGELSCSTDSTNTAVWTIANWPCSHACLSVSSSVVVQLDDSDCEQRTPSPCVLATTVQAEIDATLARLVDDVPGLREALFEDTLTVQLKNGCARALQTGFNRSPERMAVLAMSLAKVRISCAESALTCGQVEGPSTLLVP